MSNIKITIGSTDYAFSEDGLMRSGVSFKTDDMRGSPFYMDMLAQCFKALYKHELYFSKKNGFKSKDIIITDTNDLLNNLKEIINEDISSSSD